MNVEPMQANPASIFDVAVHTTNNRGFTPEEIAERCADKILSVSETAPAAIRDQAHVFRTRMVKLLTFYLGEAAKNDRTTVFNALMDAGHPDLAELIRRL
jgi:hypothetical protein|tara:strand:+ start:1101 stop:1400 length:300 start_codon:yes stop_codon:yes gene_type:complete